MNKINTLKYIIRNKFNYNLFIIFSIIIIGITTLFGDTTQIIPSLLLIVLIFVGATLSAYMELTQPILFIKPPLSHLKSKYVSLGNELEEKWIFGNEKDIEQIKIAQEQYEKAIEVLKNANL